MVKHKLPVEEIYEGADITPNFPKYTTQLMNLANQNAQGTRPKVVGQMSELIKESDATTYDEWKEWYLERHPNAIDKATNKVADHIAKLRNALQKIDEDMIREWVQDLVLLKTAEGLLIEERILRHLGEQFDRPVRQSTAEEESKGIDGYVGDVPVSIKPTTYDQKALSEDIQGAMVKYKSTDKYLTIFYDEEKLS
jgi:hypothetical protein